jgi:ribonuclease HI
MMKKNSNLLHIYIDGASRGNPGPSGIGIVFEDNERHVVREVFKYIGQTTNNVAEYTALITAMEEARKLGVKDISINTDSQLLARQLGGAYKVKNAALKELHAKAMKALDDFEQVLVNNIPRLENTAADKLANKAIDSTGKAAQGKSFVLKSRE